MVDVSVIIVSYNTLDFLRDCLASLASESKHLSIETFVVDNASSDESVAMVRRDFPGVRLIANERNVGFARANNAAMRRASGRFILLLNPDTKPLPGSVREMTRFLDANPQAGYCGPTLLNGDGTHQPSARRFPTILSSAFSLSGLAERRSESRHCTNAHSGRPSNRPHRADWLSGACLMVRREAVTDVGMLDEGFFMYFEETDWCRRMTAAGWQGWFVPVAHVVHWGGQSVVRTDNKDLFSGDHPVHWVTSSRRYMRRYHGALGTALSELTQVLLYLVIWARHVRRRSVPSSRRARAASHAIRCLLGIGNPTSRRCTDN